MKSFLITFLIFSLFNVAMVGPIFGQIQAGSDKASKIKIKVAKLGVGGKLVEVKLKDRTKVKGYITEIKDDNFRLISKKNGTSTSFSYSEVEKTQRTFSTGVYVFAGIVGGLSVLALVLCGAGKCED